MEVLIPVILIAVVIGGIILYSKRKSSERPKSRKELTGIQGWLRLLAISLVFYIANIITHLKESYTSLEFQKNFDQADPTSITTAVIIDFLPLVLGVVLFILLISKHYQFKIFFLFSSGYVIAEPWLLKAFYFVLFSIPLPMSSYELGRHFFTVLLVSIWIAYVLKSERVKYTFGY